MSGGFNISTLFPEDPTVVFKGFIDKLNYVTERVRDIISKPNNIPVQEVDQCGNIVQEAVVEVERRKDKFFKKNKNKKKYNPVESTGLTGTNSHRNYTDNQGQANNSDNLQKMIPNKSASISQGKGSRSISEGSTGSYDSKMSLNLAPSATSPDNIRNTNSIGKIHQSISSSAKKNPPLPSKIPMDSQSSFQGHVIYCMASSDDGLNQKPLAKIIVENRSLESSEPEIIRSPQASNYYSSTPPHIIETDDHQPNSLKTSMANSNTSLTSTSIRETDYYSPNLFAFSASENGTPPALPPRLLIEDPINYVTAFLPSPAINNSPSASDPPNLRKNQHIRRSSIQSTISSDFSGDSSESGSIDGTSSSSHTGPRYAASIASVVSSAEYQQFVAQAHDAHMNFNHGPSVAPRSNFSRPYSFTSTVSSVGRLELASVPSLACSSTPSVINKAFDEASNSAGGQSDRDLAANSTSGTGTDNSNYRYPRSSREPYFEEISEIDEAVTPDLQPVDTLDGDVIILQYDSMTLDEDGFRNATSSHGPRRHIH